MPFLVSMPFLTAAQNASTNAYDVVYPRSIPFTAWYDLSKRLSREIGKTTEGRYSHVLDFCMHRQQGNAQP